MSTIFDVITVTCFIGLVLAYFRFTDRELRTLWYMLVSGGVFAIANQVGNAGSVILATILILAGIGWAFLIVRQQG